MPFLDQTVSTVQSWITFCWSCICISVVAWTYLKLMTLLLQAPKCWYYRRMPPLLGSIVSYNLYSLKSKVQLIYKMFLSLSWFYFLLTRLRLHILGGIPKIKKYYVFSYVTLGSILCQFVPFLMLRTWSLVC